MVIEGRMLGNRPLWRPRSGTLILEDGMYENVKIEAMKKMIQGLTLPMTKHQRENMELSVTYFEPVCTLSAIISRSVAYQMKYIAECKMAAFYISEPKRQLKQHKISK